VINLFKLIAFDVGLMIILSLVLSYSIKWF